MLTIDSLQQFRQLPLDTEFTVPQFDEVFFKPDPDCEVFSYEHISGGDLECTIIVECIDAHGEYVDLGDLFDETNDSARDTDIY